MPTLKDIAQLVGVSISTVSRVINDDSSRHVSVETRDKVWRVAREIGYVPNESARRLVRKNNSAEKEMSKAVACILAVPQNKYNHPYFSPILAGIEDQLGELGYSLVRSFSAEEMQRLSDVQQYFMNHKLDGVIVVENIKKECYEFVKRMVPHVVGIDISDVTIPVVSYDRINASRHAVQHLIEQGHQRIGFIGGPGLTGNMEQEKRFRGYRYALIEADLEWNWRWIANTGWNVDQSYESMKEIIQLPTAERPTAMFAASDMMAISAMKAVAESRLSIPGDMAFASIDNIDVSQYTIPPLTTVHIPKFEMGQLAARTLVDTISGKMLIPYKMVVPFRLIVRESTDLSLNCYTK